MINRGVPNGDDWPEGVLDRLPEWEQGDLVAQPPFFYFADPQQPVWEATRQYTATSTEPEIILPADDLCPPYGMVTTQTCDIAEEDTPKRPMRPWVQIAPVYEVTDWKKKKLERRSPLYWVLVPDLAGGNAWVADLRIEVPVEKGWLARQERVEGFRDEAQKRKVGERLSLLRGRPAFSRELNSLQGDLWEMLEARGAEDGDVRDRLTSAIAEVGIFVDSHLHPTSVQLVFLTDTPIDDDCREWLVEWRNELRPATEEAGISLHAHDVRDLESITAGEYRRMVIIWRR
jgi:hypothetical protein